MPPAVWDRLPTVLGPAAVERLLGRPRCETRLGRRDRRHSRPCTRPAVGPRKSLACGPRDLDLAGGRGALRREREQGTIVPLGREPSTALAEYIERDRPALSVRQPETSTVFVARRAGPCRGSASGGSSRPCAGRRTTRTSVHTRSGTASPRTCSPAARPPRGPGDARPRLDRDHPDLHPRGAEPAPRVHARYHPRSE